MKCSVHWILLTITCVFLSGCKTEDPNPELLDPIYKDLQATADDYQKRYEEESVHRKELEDFIVSAEPNSLDLAKARIDLEKTLRTQEDLEQKARYYRIRRDRRRVEDRVAYKKAFHQEKEWPDANEYSGYLVNKRLNSVNLNWNARVPKLADRTSVSATRAPAKAKEGGEEE